MPDENTTTPTTVNPPLKAIAPPPKAGRLVAVDTGQTVEKPVPRFVIKPTDRRPLPLHHPMIEKSEDEDEAYTDDPVTAHTLQHAGCEVIDRLTDQPYTGKLPHKKEWTPTARARHDAAQAAAKSAEAR